MRAIPWLWTLAICVPLTITGCKGGQNSAPGGKEYPIKGKVVAVDNSKPSVKLDHEEIPELKMKGMEMEYPVENAKVLEGLKAGDQVQGTLKMESGKYIITHLEKR